MSKAPQNIPASLSSSARSPFEGMSRLADLPIEDACHERRLLDLGFNNLLRDLAKRIGKRGVISPEERRIRIIEVYRRCYYQETELAKQLAVLSEFVAYFPNLALQADWFREVVSSTSLTPDFSVHRKRYNTLLAVAEGFRRAAHPTARLQRQTRIHRLEAARDFRDDIAQQLKTWRSSLHANEALPDWLDGKVAAKVRELVNEYPSLKRCRHELEGLIRRKRHYKASNKIAASVFRVRTRSLESRAD